MKKNTKKKTQAQEDNMCTYAINNNRIHFTVTQSGMRAGSDRAWMKAKQYHRRGTVVFDCENSNEEVNTDD